MKMPMTEMQTGSQTIRYDRDATAAVYRLVERGDAEECGCIHCENFIAHRNIAYPLSFRALLEDLGVDQNKEGEVFEYGPDQDGGRLYGGWFYLVGELVTPGERNSCPADSSQFSYWFTRNCPDAPAFRGGPLLAIEFITHVKWLLPDSPDF